jgi:hypothetical protein
VKVLSIACAIATIGVLGALPAGAVRAEGVGVIAVGGERGTLASTIAAVVRETRPEPTRARVVVDAISEARIALAAGAVPIETMPRFRRVREEIDEGWRAYQRVQVEFAASRLASARTDAVGLLAYPSGVVLYADAALRLGIVLDTLGRTADAQYAIALALGLDPDRPITQLEFSPDVITTIDTVRAQVRPTVPVRITSEPPNATVNIDGKDVGRTPASVELAVGQHVVVARVPQFRPQAQAIAVEPTTPELSLGLERDGEAARLEAGVAVGLSDAAAQELADAALRFADLDEVVLVADTERRGGPTLLVQRCAGAPARCSAVVELGYADRSGLVTAAREAWQAVHAAELRYPPSVFGDSRVGDDKLLTHRCEVCRSPWLWGSIGAAAVVTTIVVLAIVTASKPAPILGVDQTQFTH